MSGEKAVVTCQKYQFSENKKIGLFQPKAPRHLALAHVELKREHVVIPAGQPQDHRSVRHHRFEPAALYNAFQQRAAIDDPFGGACRDVEAPHRFILFQNVLVKYKTRIVDHATGLSTLPCTITVHFCDDHSKTPMVLLLDVTLTRYFPSGDQRDFQYPSEPGIFCAW